MNKTGWPNAVEMATFTRLAQAALGPRVRVARDVDGWPIVPGRQGQLDWRGVESDGSARLYAFTEHGRLVPKLLAVPGARPAQVGSGEAAVWLRAGAIRAVAALLRTRVRRAPESGRSAAFLARIRLRRGAG